MGPDVVTGSSDGSSPVATYVGLGVVAHLLGAILLFDVVAAACRTLREGSHGVVDLGV